MLLGVLGCLHEAPLFFFFFPDPTRLHPFVLSFILDIVQPHLSHIDFCPLYPMLQSARFFFFFFRSLYTGPSLLPFFSPAPNHSKTPPPLRPRLRGSNSDLSGYFIHRVPPEASNLSFRNESKGRRCTPPAKPPTLCGGRSLASNLVLTV